MNCIDTKSKEFQELLEASKLPSLLLEMRIAKWQEQNGLDRFPTVDELNIKTLDYFEKQNLIKEFNLEKINTIQELIPQLKKINTPYQHLEILSSLEKVLDFSKIKFKIKELKGAKAYYVIANNTITYNSKNLDNSYPHFFIETIIHELLHAVSRSSELNIKPVIGIIEKILRNPKIKLKDYYAIKELYNLVLKNTDKTSKDFYGLTDVEEFISEAYSNDGFQEFLKNINISDENSKNLFEKFYEILLKILSLNIVKNTYFDKNKSSFEILKDIDKKSINSLIELKFDSDNYFDQKNNNEDTSIIFMKKDLSELPVLKRKCK